MKGEHSENRELLDPERPGGSGENPHPRASQVRRDRGSLYAHQFQQEPGSRLHGDPARGHLHHQRPAAGPVVGDRHRLSALAHDHLRLARLVGIHFGLARLSRHPHQHGGLSFFRSACSSCGWSSSCCSTSRSTWSSRPASCVCRLEIGEAETAYDTTGMTIQKQRSDLFRHWILGLGSGDLIVTTTVGPVAHLRHAERAVHRPQGQGHRTDDARKGNCQRRASVNQIDFWASRLTPA